MKKTLLFYILFLVPFLAFSQKKSIDGFLDIPFGSDSATVKAAIIAKGGSQIMNLSQKDDLSFQNFSMSDRKVDFFEVKFVDNKAYAAYFLFNYFNEVDILNYYDDFSSDITAVYGKGKFNNNFGDSSNAGRIKRLKSGNASCSTLWQSKNDNEIILTIRSINQSLEISLGYLDATLTNINAAKKKSDL